MNKRQIQAEATKEKISLELMSMLHTCPIDEINLRDLCRAAGVSTGAFYHHFSCKEEAVLYCFRHEDVLFLKSLALDGTPMENIQDLIRWQLPVIRPEKHALFKHMHIARLTYCDPFIFSEERPLFQILYKQILQLVQKPDAEQHAKIITKKVIQQCRGYIYNLCISEDLPGEEWYSEAVQEVIQFLLYCLAQY